MPLSTSQRWEVQKDLTKQWTDEVKAKREMASQYQLMQSSLNRFGADPLGASQGVLVTFQRILDPQSVVREAEYDRGPQGLAIRQRLEGLLSKHFGPNWNDPSAGRGGAGVPEPALRELTETARQYLEALSTTSEGVKQRIQATLKQPGGYDRIDPATILGPDAAPVLANPPAAPGAPAASAAPQSPAEAAGAAAARKTADMGRYGRRYRAKRAGYAESTQTRRHGDEVHHRRQAAVTPCRREPRCLTMRPGPMWSGSCRSGGRAGRRSASEAADGRDGPVRAGRARSAQAGHPARSGDGHHPAREPRPATSSARSRTASRAARG